MNNYLKSHWDYTIATLGFLGAISLHDVSSIIEILIACLTLIFVALRVGVWILRFRVTWRNRDNTSFFTRSKGDEE